MADGLLQGLLKTPQQVREEQLLRMQQQAVAGRQLQSPLRASSALPGIFSNVLAQQAPALATDVAQAARGITQGVGGMLGAVGQQGLGQAVAGATITPEERQAAQAQQALQGTKLQDPASLEAAAARLQQAGNVNAANALIARAQELRQGQAKLQLTQQQSMTELAQQAKQLAAAGYDKERIATEIATRNPTIGNIEAQRAASDALAEQRRAETFRTTQMLPDEIRQAQADAQKAQLETQKLDLVLGIPVSDATVESRVAAQNIINQGPMRNETRSQMLDRARGALVSEEKPKTEINVTTAAGESEFMKAFGKGQAEAYQASLETVNKANTSLQNSSQVEALLADPSFDAITGQFADFRLGMAKALNLAGVDNDELVANSEAVFASLAKNTLDILGSGQLGAGTGLSDADREFAEKAAGGRIALSREGILRIAEINRRATIYKIKQHNEQVDRINRRFPQASVPKEYYVGQQAKLADGTIVTYDGNVWK